MSQVITNKSRNVKRLPVSPTPDCPADSAFGHPRDYLGNRHVYAALSQRARGLSLGINLNPDQHCSFDCIYCEVHRDQPGRARELDLKLMTSELAGFLAMIRQKRLREIPWFRSLPDELLELKEVALSGDGEPTLCPIFSKVVKAVVSIREKELHPFKIVLITNTTGLNNPEVQQGLRQFAAGDQVWVKLDAGTQRYMTKVNRPTITLKQVLDNILTLARTRPVVVQSLFPNDPTLRLTDAEIDQYVQRLRELREAGAQIELVQIYSAHRPAHRPACTHLAVETLCEIAQRVRKVARLRAEVF